MATFTPTFTVASAFSTGGGSAVARAAGWSSAQTIESNAYSYFVLRFTTPEWPGYGINVTTGVPVGSGGGMTQRWS